MRQSHDSTYDISIGLSAREAELDPTSGSQIKVYENTRKRILFHRRSL